MTQTWHADEETLRSWADGSAPPVLAASLEAHLLRCPECRARTTTLRSAADRAGTHRRWEALVDEVDQPGANALVRLGLSTPALRAAWLGALLILIVLPGLVTLIGGRIPLMLAIAPVAPLAAVALAYGRGAEPAGELALATPSAGLRVVAARALVVVLTAVPLGVGASLAVGLELHVALGWLLPGAALAALVLLSGTTRLDPAMVAVALGSVWAVAVSSPAGLRRVPAQVVTDLVVSDPVQLTALAVAVGALVLTLVRRDTVAHRRTT